jgi:hypothetical protein
METHNHPLTKEDILNLKSISQYNESLQYMQNDMDILKEDVRDIKQALIGDEFNPGFKQRIEKVEVDTGDNTLRISKLYTYGSAVVSVLGLLGLIFGLLSKFGII